MSQSNLIVVDFSVKAKQVREDRALKNILSRAKKLKWEAAKMNVSRAAKNLDW